jgi:glycosyltransferase involved in cell wall biosynthesis
VAVVIPMFNEEAGAARCVAAVCRTLDAMPVSSRLIVVDDGSRDGTAEALARLLTSEPRLEVIAHPVNRGYGAALRSGVEAAARAKLDYVLFMDSDLTNAPEDIPRFVAAMTPGVDVIKATRYRGGGGMRGVPFARQAISRIGNTVARALFRIGISDCTNGFRALRTTLATRLRLRESRFPVILEELYCCVFAARGFAEVPVVLTNRSAALRRTSFAYRPAVLWLYFKYALLAGLRVPPRGRLDAADGSGASGAN